jgi:drug/metabolite transporter (DMT)-like permease
MNVTPTALLLVLACAAGWASLDLLRKLLSNRMRVVALVLFMTAGQLPLLAVWLVLDGGPQLTGGWLDGRYWLPALASLGLNVSANFSFVRAIKISPFSLTVPLLSLTPVFMTLLAIPLLGEVPRPVQWLGIVLVVAGALLLHLHPGRGTSLAAWWQGVRRERGSQLMVWVALAWSLTMPFDKLAVRHASAPFHALVLSGGIAAAALCWLLPASRRQDLKSIGAAPGLLTLAVLASTAALGFQLLAMQRVWVGLLESVKRGLGSLLAVVWGRLLFGEPFTTGKWVAVLLMAAGVALVLN